MRAPLLFTRALALPALALALALLPGGAAADNERGEGQTMIVPLSGAVETPPGDPNGRGSALLLFLEKRQRVCFNLSVSGIGPATAAHIHHGAVGTAGPIVIALTPPTNGFSTGCLDGVDDRLIHDILSTPSQYYVNVHTAAFPGGAVRGQLMGTKGPALQQPLPAPGTTGAPSTPTVVGPSPTPSPTPQQKSSSGGY